MKTLSPQKVRKKPWSLFVRGMAMGAADVVPGVSGGTIAFITGIYEELLNSIRAFNPTNLRLLWAKQFREAWKRINGGFLFSLFLGILTSFVTLAKGIEYALENHPIRLWAFFFGLVVASAFVVLRKVKVWSAPAFISLGVGTATAFGITVLAPATTPDTYWFLFLAGMIAICAMILPGVSGSFLLVLMGKYQSLLSAVNERNVVVLIVFAAGCGVGLISFSHLISYLLRRFHSVAIALLSGFLIGSLNKIWPWKKTLETQLDRHGELIPVREMNLLPLQYANLTDSNPYLASAIGFMFIGATLVLTLELGFGSRRQEER
ncbi:MAG: DUF368 domain-containing protein [Okeania sp. SIO1H5]|nr:DUF368 domain-containing protein [Okeania sp. SIO1H5]